MARLQSFIARPEPLLVGRTQARAMLGGISTEELNEMIANEEVRIIRRGIRQFIPYVDLAAYVERIATLASEQEETAA